MNKFFIKIQDSKPAGHPVDELSARTIGSFEYKLTDGSIPDNYEPYHPVNYPDSKWDEKVTGGETLEKVEGVWQKVYAVKLLTSEEKAAEKARLIKEFDDNFGYTNWIFYDESGGILPPNFPEPDLKNPKWDDTNQKWIEGDTLT